jgi:GrpB-like predicted nucleotidyltransferase (UPF0157 family)
MGNVVRSDEELAAMHLQPIERLDGPIYLAPYDPDWPRQYERVAERIRAALGERAVVLEHAGSTSIPGMPAKPKIDIVLGVADTADEPSYVPDMEAHGFPLRIREPDWHEHRLFKGPDPNVNVNLHTFTVGCLEIERMVRFRDHLRADTADRQLYEGKKRELAQRTWKYTQHYADAKSEVVEEILTRSGVTASECVRY